MLTKYPGGPRYAKKDATSTARMPDNMAAKEVNKDGSCFCTPFPISVET